MTYDNLFDKFYSKMINEAYKSPLQSQLCAAILKDKKMISKPCCNTTRNLCHGQICGSIHAEAHALMSYFGKDLQFDRGKNRWYLLCKKWKEYKKT